MKRRPILLLLMLIACAEGPEPLAVHVPARIELGVGETARLDATSTPSQAGLSYRWTLLNKPRDSAPGLVGVSASTLYFTPDRAGAHLVSVTVSDGSRTSLAATTEILVHRAPQLSGDLRVRVLDASNGQPLPRATVAVEGLKTTTDVDGFARLAGAKLQAPVTVRVTSSVTRRHDHDDDPATPAVEWPWYRGATLVDVSTPEITVALHPTVEPQVPVRGRVDASLFDLIPEVDPALALGTGHASHQARVVMIAPLPREPLEDLQPQHLFARRPNSDLPANLATDDPSIHALAPFLGVESPLDDEPLTHFETRASPGRQTFFVLGGVVTLHLDGVKWQPQADEDIYRQGRFEMALTFAALVTLDVPAQGLELSQALRPELFDEVWRLDTRVEHLTASATDLLTGEALQLERVRLGGAREVKAPLPASVPDARLEHWQDRYLSATNDAGAARLRVPHQTGPAATDLPFHLLMAAATTPAGVVVPLGFALVRDMDRTLEATTFRWPEKAGSLEGARYEVMAAARRDVWASEASGQLVPGDSRQLTEVIDDQVSALEPAPLPHDPYNRWNGLMNKQMGERADPDHLPYDLVRTVPLFIHSGLPGNPGRSLLFETQGHARLHTVLSRKYSKRQGEELRSDDFGLWDIHQPAGLTTTVPLPELESLPFLGEHTELRVEVTATAAQRKVARDTFLIRLP